MDSPNIMIKPENIHIVNEESLKEYDLFVSALSRSSLVALDAEWPRGSEFATLLQVACRTKENESLIFLVDLILIKLDSIYGLLDAMFVSPETLKLGFRFHVDLKKLSTTFSREGYPGFLRVKPYLDIDFIFKHLLRKNEKIVPKDMKGLAYICGEILGFSLSKEQQCSDWARRPLTEEQITYAALDVQCLFEMFDIFQANVLEEVSTSRDTSEPLGVSLSSIILKYGDICLREPDAKTKTTMEKGHQKPSTALAECPDWEGPPPWDSSVGGDGCQKFMCGVPLGGLAKMLRKIGFDTIIIDGNKGGISGWALQAKQERRVFLTKTETYWRTGDFASNQIYRLKSAVVRDQLLEVIELFGLNISENIARCTECNGTLERLTTEEVLEHVGSFSEIPNFYFNNDLEFFGNCKGKNCKGKECKHLYAEELQYLNPFQKLMGTFFDKLKFE